MDEPERHSPGLVRPMPVRPVFRRLERETGLGGSDESLSGESLGTSSVAGSGSGSGGSGGSFGSVGNVPERNKVVLERIRRGLDARTTIMIKNVPNKYTQVRNPFFRPCSIPLVLVFVLRWG